MFVMLQVAKVLKMLKTLQEHKNRTEHSKMRDRAAKHEKLMEKVNAKRSDKRKEVKKQAYRALGKLERRKNKYKPHD